MVREEALVPDKGFVACSLLKSSELPALCWTPSPSSDRDLLQSGVMHFIVTPPNSYVTILTVEVTMTSPGLALPEERVAGLGSSKLPWHRQPLSTFLCASWKPLCPLGRGRGQGGGNGAGPDPWLSRNPEQTTRRKALMWLQPDPCGPLAGPPGSQINRKSRALRRSL